MGRLYDQTAPHGPGQSPVEPDIEVDETEEFYLVKAELPGITRDNVELQVDEHSLSITGSVREEQGEHLIRRRAGRFFYRTVLPRDIAVVSQVSSESFASTAMTAVRQQVTERRRSTVLARP